MYYEWTRVTRGDRKEPHRVFIRTDNILHNERTPHQNPLEKSAPKGLYFNVEFMQAFAVKRWPGTTHTGSSSFMPGCIQRDRLVPPASWVKPTQWQQRTPRQRRPRCRPRQTRTMPR